MWFIPQNDKNLIEMSRQASKEELRENASKSFSYFSKGVAHGIAAMGSTLTVIIVYTVSGVYSAVQYFKGKKEEDESPKE